MQFRYLGFDQQQNTRIYRFQGVVKGEPARDLVIAVDVTLFLAHHIGIQEGPMLCAQKLASDLENLRAGDHRLTEEDFRSHANARAIAQEQKIEGRRARHHQRPVE